MADESCPYYVEDLSVNHKFYCLAKEGHHLPCSENNHSGCSYYNSLEKRLPEMTEYFFPSKK